MGKAKRSGKKHSVTRPGKGRRRSGHQKKKKKKKVREISSDNSKEESSTEEESTDTTTSESESELLAIRRARRGRAKKRSQGKRRATKVIPSCGFMTARSPGLRAFLRFLSGLYSCLNRGGTPVTHTQSSGSAMRVLVSLHIDNVFVRIKESGCQEICEMREERYLVCAVLQLAVLGLASPFCCHDYEWQILSSLDYNAADDVNSSPKYEQISDNAVRFKHQGPYGFEDTIGAGGAPLTFIALVLIPCIWSIPLALLTAELSCMIPESGGNVVWVHRAFGPFWAFFNGCIASACSILDNALYPVLFIDYVNAITFNFEEGNGMSSSLCMLIKVALAVSVAVVNICGIDLIGTASLATGLIVLSPFTVMVLLGLRYLSLEWGPSSSPHPVRWGRFITVLLWNTSG
ncbi:hypothetical protein CBR_g34596 [Chara braunii]|uniref:Amino acid permease/ SLC12A domain-containing protein n=1 Tax=Chara braunii TaxID=69332 RepID=A0A388LJB4_CHABU|nr:hypothetical protein CBR_g34596 [Chara braunii]|eukprot:GBG82312.1 hypothetical protein CBR_g34596 [Chara braunii]